MSAAAAVLVAHAKRILREAGARFTFVHPIETFSHALGTVRMGLDPARRRSTSTDATAGSTTSTSPTRVPCRARPV